MKSPGPIIAIYYNTDKSVEELSEAEDVELGLANRIKDLESLFQKLAAECEALVHNWAPKKEIFQKSLEEISVKNRVRKDKDRIDIKKKKEKKKPLTVVQNLLR
ncbi:hypothetical protein F8M41_001118 [Gigaspora margarita]|uniref:Uncharacterized protein n=1 Tax=Gigaspora margarita TaxID=4874 RepID=A0A8H4ESP6_GIGMA|nr:hypothetical protein F8M41_001118 [Gigaspora margarita]